MKLLLLSCLMVSLGTSAFAGALDKKGKWYFFYGYNRAEYSNSDYHVTGNGNDFTLRNVKAKDGQSAIGADPYLNPFAWSVPQNSIHIGYYLTDNLSISLGNDHMKYIMESNQVVNIDGTIATGGIYNGTYVPGDTVTISPDFLLFEHTDGLNFVSLELEHYIPLWKNGKETHALSFYWGPGLAIMYPKTNATLFGQARHDEFHIAGHGYSIKAGLEFIFYEDYFTRLVVKQGHINITDAKTTADSADSLAHEFDFTELYLVLGLNF